MSAAEAAASGRFSDYLRRQRGERSGGGAACPVTGAKAAPVRPVYRDALASGNRSDGAVLPEVATPYMFDYDPLPMPVMPGCPDPSGVPIPKNMEGLPRDHRGRPVFYITLWSSEREHVVRYDPIVGHSAIFMDGGYGIGKPLVPRGNWARIREMVCQRLCKGCKTPLHVEGFGWVADPWADREIKPGGCDIVAGLPLCAQCLRYSMQVCGPLTELRKTRPCTLLHVARVSVEALEIVHWPAFPPELFDVESIEYNPPTLGGQRLTENPVGRVGAFALEGFERFTLDEFMELTAA